MTKKNAPLEAGNPVPEIEVPEDEGQIYVVAVHGDMRHLFTNVVFTKDPKKVTIDGFLQAQLDAGKLQVVTP